MYTEKSIVDYGLGPSTTRKEEKPRKRDRVVPRKPSEESRFCVITTTCQLLSLNFQL